eukprot:TRINITY_DN3496_c0_g1_i1.p1 TRINITY_DN3496_c0_g1~~TRINITY_DN3496_c0_g1_i1.p1  ORF type:complete len:272 (+),score=28.72 TRINITY_DN3496_c0_g1_i1:430-1245(+)
MLLYKPIFKMTSTLYASNNLQHSINLPGSVEYNEQEGKQGSSHANSPLMFFDGKEFLSQCIPVANYINKTTSTKLITVRSRSNPAVHFTVKHWGSFSRIVEQCFEKVSLCDSFDHEVRFAFPDFFPTSVLDSEIALQLDFKNNIGNRMCQFIQKFHGISLAMEENIGGSQSRVDLGFTHPVLYTQNSVSELVASVLVKRRAHLAELDLVDDFHEPNVKSTLSQLVQHFKSSSTQYGLITTYQTTWFVKCCADGEIMVTEPIKRDRILQSMY